MTKIVATYRDQYGHEHKVINPYLVNRGGWFGKTYILQVAIANALNPLFVVEAGNESDAIDEFIDSEWGHWLVIDEADVKDWHENDVSYGGNESKPYLPHQVWVAKCAVDYGDYLLSDTDEAAYENWLRDLFLTIPDDTSALRYKLRWSPSIMGALKIEFREEWQDYVEEQNADKNDSDYNKNIAGKEVFE